MAVIGIDLGTTNSLCAVCRDGKIELVPNPNGDYLTPSVVSFGDQGEVYVGKIAKEMQITRPKQTFAEFKRDMGTDRIFRACGQEYRAEELSAFVLKKLKEDAEKFLGEPVTEAVISVPAYFDDDVTQRKMPENWQDFMWNGSSMSRLRLPCAIRCGKRRWRLSLSLILEVEH